MCSNVQHLPDGLRKNMYKLHEDSEFGAKKLKPQ